jgi:colanic acid biosynthesis glycosyl transferase WcaI
MARLLIWSPNYAPEPTGIPPLVTDAAEWLVERGHSVDVVTAVPNYPERRIHGEYRSVLWRSETRNGVRVHRSWLRARPERTFADKALYELTISTFALPNAVRAARRADVIVCVVPTLLAARYAASIARRVDKRLVLWVQDLVLSAAQSVEAGRFAQRALDMARRLERSAALAADRIVVCSEGFATYLAENGAPRERITTVHNWADLDTITPTVNGNGHGHVNGNGHAPRFLYAGNLGHTQGFETLIDAARMSPEVDVEIVGAGNAADDVRALADSAPNVSVRDPVEESAYPRLLGSAHAHIVLQRRISAGANLPSKIATSLASGRPIIGSIDLQTPAAELLRRSGAAILVEPEEPAALAAAMRELASDADRRKEMGRRGRAFAERHLAKEPALRKLETAIVG